MTMTSVKQTTVAIIGAGPAGIAAAIQLKRSGVNALLFEESRIGGLLRNAFWIENYPGYPNGISGTSLIRKMGQHLESLKIRVLMDQIVQVAFQRSAFFIRGARTYQAAFVVIASGTKPRMPDYDLEALGNRVFFEIYPLRRVKNKTITIIGAGDAAFDYALNLGRNNTVAILNRNNYPKALHLLVERTKKGKYARSVSYRSNAYVKNIACRSKQVICEITKGRQKEELTSDYLIFAIGREPDVDFLPPSLRRIFPHGSKQLYFAGDVRRGNIRQTAVAVGDGIKVAMNIVARLNN